MIFELLHAPFPANYTETLLPLAECKAHLRITNSFEDDLIAALRDASIEFIEEYCSVKLGPMTGMEWQAERFPACDRTALVLGVRPVSMVTAISWADSAGDTVTGNPSDFRLSLHGDLLPAIGKSWPTDVAGEVRITFDAGYVANSAPQSLLQAAKMFLGHLFIHREAVVTSGNSGEVPFGVTKLCASFRRVVV